MKFEILVNKIQETHRTLQENAVSSINRHLTIRNWLIGHYIIEFEQKGEDRAKYDQLTSMGLEFPLIRQTLSDEFQNVDNHGIELFRNPVFPSSFGQEYSIIVPPDKIITRLSYSHLVQLFPIEDPIKRAFYEMECIKGNWSVRELKRQINTLYYERSGMSRRPDQLSRLVQEKGEETNVADIIKSPFTFEFLGLQAKDVARSNWKSSSEKN